MACSLLRSSGFRDYLHWQGVIGFGGLQIPEGTGL
jgi:hypothetical protein